jgi:hypothetical protein
VPLNGDDDYYYRMFSAWSESDGSLIEGNRQHRLVPGQHALHSLGGRDIGSFTVTIQVPEAMTWIDRDSFRDIDRNRDLRLSWSGGRNDGSIVVQGASVKIIETDLFFPDTDVTSFICVAPRGSTSFTVPAAILRALPASSGEDSIGVLGIAAFGDQTPFGAPATRIPQQTVTATLRYVTMITQFVSYK